MNSVNLVGRLGQDPELKQTSNGSVLSLRMVTSEYYRDRESGEFKELPEWHNVELWGPSAERLSETLSKGCVVAVEGSIVTRKWKDSSTGGNRYFTSIKAKKIRMHGRPQSAGEGNSYSGSNARSGAQAPKQSVPMPDDSPSYEDVDDDLPF